MNKALSLVLCTALFYTTQSSAIIISVDTELTTRTETELAYGPTGTNVVSETTTNITPVSGNIVHEVDIEQAKADGIDYGYNSWRPGAHSYFLDLTIQGADSTGPFYNQLMGLVDVGAYSRGFQITELWTSSRFDENAPYPGSDIIQFVYQQTGTHSTSNGNLLHDQSYTYFSTFSLTSRQYATLADVSLNNLDELSRRLMADDGKTFGYTERLSVSSIFYENGIATSGSNSIIQYRGTATYNVLATAVPEPGSLVLVLLGLAGGATFRRKK